MKRYLLSFVFHLSLFAFRHSPPSLYTIHYPISLLCTRQYAVTYRMKDRSERPHYR